MGFLKLLSGAFPGGWIVYAAIAAAIFGAGSFAAYKVTRLIDAPIISQAEAAQAKAEKNLAETASKIDAAIAENERIRADDQMKAREESDTLNARIVQLQSELVRVRVERAKVSARLTEELSHAPASDTVALGPAALRFLDGVRREQAGSGDGSPPP